MSIVPNNWAGFSEKTERLLAENGYLFEKRPFDYKKDGDPVRESELKEAVESTNKPFLMINLTEFWECDMFNHAGGKHFIKLHDFLETIIPLNRVILVGDDCNLAKLYDKWFETTNYKEKMHVISYPILFAERSREYIREDQGFGGNNFHVIERYKDRRKLPSKKLMCLMGIYSRHRNSLQKFFHNNDLWESNYISYIGNDNYKNPILLPDSGIMERIAMRSSTPRTDFGLAKYFKDSCYSFIPESNKWTVAPNSLFLTEKTTKVLYHGHPFMIMSSVGALKQLREWGFETFPEMFDETYDEIENAVERDRFFKNNMLRLQRMELSELHKLCESVEEKCIHNQKVLLESKIIDDKFYNEISGVVNSSVVVP